MAGMKKTNDHVEPTKVNDNLKCLTRIGINEIKHVYKLTTIGYCLKCKFINGRVYIQVGYVELGIRAVLDLLSIWYCLYSRNEMKRSFCRCCFKRKKRLN